MRKHIIVSTLITAFAMPSLANATGDDGNRYSDTLPREYKAEISASQAYIETLAHRRHQHDRHHKRGGHAVIIDVRTVEEYVGGHPPRAYSIPFPHVYNRQHNPDKGEYIPQDPADFIAAVDALDLPKETMIITMCRTGFRSVLAGNLLAAAGYTNVYNMWEGFVGRLKQNLAAEYVDLDGDGDVDGSDPYSKDRDGWANFGGLPVSTRLTHWRLNQPFMNLYYNVEGER